MVFCGRLSKACERCRVRRLKCDLKTPSCGQCIRAQILCSGYRDTRQIRFKIETPEARSNTVTRATREEFFGHYVTGGSKTWGFLDQFSSTNQAPECLSTILEAVSLAYLSHQAYSVTALTNARKKYISALQATNKALQDPVMAAKNATLVASLLLDLYEKITNSTSCNDKSWSGHVNGALALVELRGVEQFHSHHELQILLKICTNLIISCVVCGTRVPPDMNALREYGSKFFNTADPKWELSGLMITYANICSDIRDGRVSVQEALQVTSQLDEGLQQLTANLPPQWQPRVVEISSPLARVYGSHYEVYITRSINQALNVVRFIRIIINKFLLRSALTPAGKTSPSYNTLVIGENIQLLAQEICATVPQYANCYREARSRIFELTSVSPEGTPHQHSPAHVSDVYSLILPLYVAGRSSVSPRALKEWVISELTEIGCHFGVANATLVKQILDRGEDINPWEVYVMLGSYAFTA